MPLRSTRALLVAPGGKVLAFAVAANRAALEQSLHKFSARCTRLDDYDDVAYHFFVHNSPTSADDDRRSMKSMKVASCR
jgi:hypothetical protein